MNKKVTDFLDEVCIHINCKEVHEDIREELVEHIYELNEENIKNGYTKEKALDLAIRNMGSTDEIGIKLNSQHKPQTEWSIIILTIIISAFGACIMFLSDKSVDASKIIISRYIAYSIIGIISMFVFYYFDYTKLKKAYTGSYILGVGLLIITIFAGIQVNGATRWLSFGSMSISTPEISSLLFLIGFTGMLEKYKGKSFFNILKLGAYGVSSVILLMLLPSLASALVLIMTYSIIVLFAVIKNHFAGNIKIQLSVLVGSGLLCIGALILNIMSSPYKFARVFYFISRKNANASGINYFQNMADKWLNLSKWIGGTNATYNGYDFHSTLPNVLDEYILINIIVTLGLAIGIGLIVFIGILIVRMFLMTNRVKNRYGFYLSIAMCSTLSVQFVINILMSFNFFPLIGINLPFVSYGSTEYIINMTMIGIILSIWRRDNLISYKEDILGNSSKKGIINYSDGKIVIDLKSWKI